MKTLAIITAALILSATATPAMAVDQESSRLSYADIDLNSSKGQAALDRRIDRIARQLCDTANDRFGNPVRAQQRACRQDIDASVRIELRRGQPTYLTSR